MSPKTSPNPSWKMPPTSWSWAPPPPGPFRRAGPWGALSRRLLVVVAVDFLEFGVDHVLAVLTARMGGVGVRGRAFARGGLLGVVHRLAQLHRGLDQRLGLGRDHLGVATLDHAL